jgi:hypothetical protein
MASGPRVRLFVGRRSFTKRIFATGSSYAGGPRHDLVIRGLLAAQTDDHQVVAHGLARFAGLPAGVHRKE